jgi:hypothetical protein
VRGLPRNMTQPSPDLPPPSEVPIRERHIRAPQGDGEVLIEPPLAKLQRVLDENLKRITVIPPDYGYHYETECYNARQQLVRAAVEYTRQYSNATEIANYTDDPNLVVAGHQPELFHPGVWLKNFVLDRCGYLPNTVAINLIVDNDVADRTSVRIPVGDLDRPQFEEVPIDEPGHRIPFEERKIVSTDALQSFPSRLRDHFEPSQWFKGRSSLVADHLWEHVEQPHREVGRISLPLGEWLAQARHRLEQQLGLQTLELPLSQIAQSISFRKFALRILLDLPRFVEIYNRSLAEYRAVNKIRSNSHPVPALVADGEWLEAPFWIWTTDSPQRKRLFARNRSVGSDDTFIELSDRDAIHFDLHTSIYHGGSLTDELKHLESRGIKIRPRALITTMYARLFLSDLFIHGIGGAKYDELTDAIIRRFFGIEPPAFMTVTGTVRLPIPRPDVSAADVRNVKQLIREIRFHPEKFVNDASPAIRESATQFAAKKAELLRQHQFHFRGASAEQFRALDDLNQQLHVLLTDVEIRLRDELKERERDYQTNRLLGSREFSFVLHPADELPEQLKRMAAST